MSNKAELKTSYLTAEEYEAVEMEEETIPVELDNWDETMARIAQQGSSTGKVSRLVIPRNKEFSRKDVVTAFSNAFELIGGTPRLALWAHQNEGDFFKLYSRLLPSQASSALGEANEMIIKHVLPRGPLDE